MVDDNIKSKQEDLIIEAKNFFDFYKREMGDSLRKGNNVIYLDFMKLTEFSNKLSDEILANPEEVLRYIELAIEESGLVKNVRVRLFALPEVQQLKIRNIRSKHLNELIVIEGIIRQTSDVRPQVVNAKFECPSCGTIISVLQIEKKFQEPSRCSCGRKGGFKLISKEMVDTQRLIIEESPESLSGGEQPKRMTVFVQEDLVEPRMEEKTTPGAKIKVIGILKEVPVPLQTGGMSTRFELAVEANNVIALEETFDELNITDEDEKQILELSQDREVFEKLAKSITPSVWGYEEIKKALVLQLFSGVQKIKPDGSKTRADIHILLIGDPGVAKSVTLGFMANLSPKGRYVVGKSTSGAGLTATVVRDEYLKGWSLEAGAMVLAHKGLVCIDELEKMDPQDRSAMHEAMEQQCYHYNTLITLADGSRHKIGELVEKIFKKNKEKIINGKDCLILPVKNLEIFTTDFKKIFKTKVDRISKHKAFNKFIKITYSNKKSITITPEHPIFIIKNKKIITKRADLVKKGEFIPTPLNFKNKKSLKKFNSNIGIGKISKVEIIPNKKEKWVYDVTIEPYHTFISNGMILHNTVTISKANVQASLKAETSVLAAANPKFGRFDPYQPIAQQIDLPPTLINRFDIIFTLRDIPDREKDLLIAKHVLNEHQKKESVMYIPRELFRKYVAYAKQKIKPELSDEAASEIETFYVTLRNSPVSSDSALKPIPISARQLQALIRMAEASAKMRLSPKVSIEDARRAIDIMKYYLMQVGYDYESKTFDIDRFSSKFSSSQRNKIFSVKEVIIALESKMGKLVPVEEVEKELQDKMTSTELQEALNKLAENNEIYFPKRGYVGIV